MSVQSCDSTCTISFCHPSFAQTVKFGTKTSSESVASMPGARSANDRDMSAAERVKFGAGPSGTPGAVSASAGDMSAAERVKFGTSSGSASMPGAQEGNDDELSPAARLKFGDRGSGGGQSAPGAQSGSDVNVSQAERLKFGSAASSSRGMGHGAHDGSTIETSAAENLKFGAAASSNRTYEPEGVARGGMRSSDSSQNYSDDEEGLEAIDEHDDDSDEEYQRKTARKKKKEDFEDEVVYDEEGGMYNLQPVDEDPYNMPYDGGVERNSEGRKATDDGWRSLCVLCSCLSCAIIIGLSVGLARAASSSSGEVTKVVEVLPPPSISPTGAPSSPPEDFTWCYESNESMALENPNYASIRSTLVDSGISTDAEFSDELSYQRKALCWLAIGDRLRLDATDPFLEQRYALAAMFYYFNEPNLLASEGWLSGKSECDWNPSIECDARTDTTVSRLDLRSNGLNGQLPKEMSVLRDVAYLDLSSNQLSGDISDVTAGWTHLEELRLSSNSFESFPSSIDAWERLKYFDISSNELTGTIPEDLTMLTQLEFLDLAINDFDGTIPDTFQNMTSLGSLYMHSTLLEGSMPASVCDLTTDAKLKHLSVDCRVPNPEVECSCCSVCNDYDVDRSPFDR